MEYAAYVVSVIEVGVAWFPQQYSEVFFLVKGILALTSTLLIILHMNWVWWKITTLGQRLRYLTLLAFSILIAGGSVEQVKDNALVNYRNLGGLAVTIMLIVAMLVSIREDRKQ